MEVEVVGPGGGVLRGLSTFTRVGVQSVVSGVALTLVRADGVDAHRVAVAVVTELASFRRALVDVCTHTYTYAYTYNENKHRSLRTVKPDSDRSERTCCVTIRQRS